MHHTVVSEDIHSDDVRGAAIGVSQHTTILEQDIHVTPLDQLGLTPGVEGSGSPRVLGMKVGSVEMTLDGMNVQDRKEQGRTFHSLSVPQASWTDETGRPKLPVIRTLLMIPSYSDVEIEIDEGDLQPAGGHATQEQCENAG